MTWKFKSSVPRKSPPKKNSSAKNTTKSWCQGMRLVDPGLASECNICFIPSLKLTFSPLKIGGWETTFLLGSPIFRGELLVLGRIIFWILGFYFCWPSKRPISVGKCLLVGSSIKTNLWWFFILKSNKYHHAAILKEIKGRSEDRPRTDRCISKEGTTVQGLWILCSIYWRQKLKLTPTRI